MDNVVKFTKNWNGKLNCQYISTIRPASRKYMKGSQLTVLNTDPDDKMEFPAIVEHTVERIFSEIPDHELICDTGMPAEDAKKMFHEIYRNIDFSKQNFVTAVLKRTSSEEIKKTQGDLFEALNAVKNSFSSQPEPEQKPTEQVYVPAYIKRKLAVKTRLNEIAANYKVAFLDTETTGLQGEVIEIHIRELDHRAFDTHGISLSDLADKEHIHFFKDRIQEILNEYFIFIYNSSFDIRMMQASIEEYAKAFDAFKDGQFFFPKSACLMTTYAEYAGIPSSKGYHKNGFMTHKLTEACRRENVDIRGITAHRAGADCEMSRRLFMKLMTAEPSRYSAITETADRENRAEQKQ